MSCSEETSWIVFLLAPIATGMTNTLYYYESELRNNFHSASRRDRIPIFAIHGASNCSNWVELSIIHDGPHYLDRTRCTAPSIVELLISQPVALVSCIFAQRSRWKW